MAAPAGISVATEFHGGTLTDTDASAERMLAEVRHPNLLTLWQPHNGAPTPDCLAGLRAVLPRLGNVHVFHWWPTSADRHPLAEGAERWAEFLAVLRAAPSDRFALLEFVQNDDPAAFRRDAETLKRWLAEGSHG